MQLSHLTQLLDGRLCGIDTCFSGVSIDTRTLKPGELFIALKGAQFDGHDFVALARQKKAAAALVTRPISCDIPQLQVTDTIKALGKLAMHHRQQFTLPTIGITGSCGKTTVRSMLTHILQNCGPVLASEKSFNNAIGLPLTLLRLNKSHQYAVIEMGTNHFGEISYLTHLTQPTAAVITNAAAAHLAGLETVQGVSRAKGEIFQGLSANGVAIINADDPYAGYWKSLLSLNHSSLQFSASANHKADIWAEDCILDSTGRPQFKLHTPYGNTSVKMPLLGKHNIANALAAAAAASALNIPLAAIKTGLENNSAVSNRLEAHTIASGARVIDDSYNANPLSFQAAVELLARMSGTKILVIADMKELGAKATEYHQALGQEARRQGIDYLYCYGALSQTAAQAFGKNAQHFTDQGKLIKALRSQLTSQTTVLIKGSRSMQMDKVVRALGDN